MYVCACILAAGRQGYPPRPGRTLPRIRRGRCWHRPVGLALPQGPAAGVNARPTIQGKREVEPRTADRRPLGRGRSLHRPLRRGAAGCRLPVPLPRVRHMVGRAISPAANPSAAANLSGGRERPPYKTGQTGIRTGNGRHRLGQTQGKPLPKCPRRFPVPRCPPRPFTVS